MNYTRSNYICASRQPRTGHGQLLPFAAINSREKLGSKGGEPGAPGGKDFARWRVLIDGILAMESVTFRLRFALAGSAQSG